MEAGEVWWVDTGDLRPVVLVTDQTGVDLFGMYVVEPSGTDITGIAAEVSVGAVDGLPIDGVLRVALPNSGSIHCTWLFSVTDEKDLAGRIGILSPSKLREVERLVALGGGI